MAANNVRVQTPAFYRGLPVTVVGCVDEVLIAVAAYATPFERALGVIAVRPRRSAHRYYVTGHAGAIETLEEAALLTAQLREAKDRAGIAAARI